MTDMFRIVSVTDQPVGHRSSFTRISEGTATVANHVTAVTGRNGVGKSRMLSNIAAVFEAVSGAQPRPRISTTVEYMIGRTLCSARLANGRIRTLIGGIEVEPSSMPRPKRVAAVTASAFDKFHLPRGPQGHLTVPLDGDYRYLGLKDVKGRISATAGVYRALDQLFDSVASDQGHRSRVGEVFRDLGYEPRVEVKYDWTSRGGGLVKAGTEVGQSEYGAFMDSGGASESWVDAFNAERREILVRELAQAVELMGELGTGRSSRLLADFQNPTLARRDHLQAAQLLRRADMIRIVSVSLTRLGSWDQVELKDASSGELGLVTAMLGIASAIDDGSLILIDEPEISFHPDWQSRYVERLTRVFGGFSGCHFVIATHSPLVVAGLGEQDSNVISLESNIEVNDLEGKSVDEALVRAFGVAGPDNLYVKQSLVRALRMASDGTYVTPEFSSLISILQSASRATDIDPAVRMVIDDLEATVAKARSGQIQ